MTSTNAATTVDALSRIYAWLLGEAAAQTLGLAIDPYRVGSAAEEARKAGLVSSEQASGPFAALATLRKD